MEQALTWVTENKELLILLGFFSLLLLVCVSPVFILYRKPKKVQTVSGEMMNLTRAQYEKEDHERRIRERQLVVDGFEDMLLGLFSRGQISESCYKYWHGKLATAITLSDYINQNLSSSPKALKEALRRRRNGGSYHYIYEPVNIPGRKPGEKEVQPRNELEAFLLAISK